MIRDNVRFWREYPYSPGEHEDHYTVKTCAKTHVFRVMFCRDCNAHYRVMELSIYE